VDTRSVSPAAKTTYYLSAVDAGGETTTSTVTIDVLQPPRIEYFEAFKDGRVWKLKWQVTGTDPAATRVSIDPEIGDVGISSDGMELRGSPEDQYTLTVEAPGGNVSKQVQVPAQPEAR
jgi:hypothetical protein